MDTGAILMLLYVFVLACFAGYQLISKVPPTLHTPLMSGANAISGITVLGAMLAARIGPGAPFNASTILGMLAVALASINVVGGFMVTDRMMGMFKSKN
ncbi:MAG: NAD(P) transhydrogenase subunit alpha [Planctomycetes bacterium]|nr:NAD(P) transhydrogenase subunit alpha [Planctomycetota bacterium]